MQEPVANGKVQAMPQPPQFAESLTKLKPSSITPLQSLSRPSQASTPALVFTHSQPLLVISGAVRSLFES